MSSLDTFVKQRKRSQKGNADHTDGKFCLFQRQLAEDKDAVRDKQDKQKPEQATPGSIVIGGNRDIGYRNISYSIVFQNKFKIIDLVGKPEIAGYVALRGIKINGWRFYKDDIKIICERNETLHLRAFVVYINCIVTLREAEIRTVNQIHSTAVGVNLTVISMPASIRIRVADIVGLPVRS